MKQYISLQFNTKTFFISLQTPTSFSFYFIPNGVLSEEQQVPSKASGTELRTSEGIDMQVLRYLNYSFREDLLTLLQPVSKLEMFCTKHTEDLPLFEFFLITSCNSRSIKGSPLKYYKQVDSPLKWKEWCYHPPIEGATIK